MRLVQNCHPTGCLSALALTGCLSILSPALGQDTLGKTEPNSRGIRHQISISIKSDPAFSSTQKDSEHANGATLIAKVLISDHAQETSFYGLVPASISDFDPIKGSPEQQVWEDAKCHHERGIPKMAAISVEGSLINGQGQFPISAHIRRIGQLVPADELSVGRSLPTGRDDIGPFRAIRAQTLQSHLLLDLKLHILPCELVAAHDENSPSQLKAGGQRSR